MTYAWPFVYLYIRIYFAPGVFNSYDISLYVLYALYALYVLYAYRLLGYLKLKHSWMWNELKAH